MNVLVSDFDKKVDEARRKGLTDTQIIDELSKLDSEFAQKAQQSRGMFNTDQNIRNDRDLLNFISKHASGRTPTVPSVADNTQLAQQATAIQNNSVAKNPLEAAGQIGAGVLKGIGSTISGMSSLGQKMLEGTVGKAIGVKKSEKTAGQMVQEKLKPVNIGEKIGFGAEQIGEFLVPGTSSLKLAGAVKGSKLIGTVAKTDKAKNLAGLAARSVAEAGIIGGQTALQKGEVNDEVKTAALIGGMFPILGAGVKKTGGVIKGTGERIQRSVIKPSIRDVKDGFKIENVNKYNLGGSLGQTLSRTTTKLNSLSDDLNKKLSSSKNTIDLNEILNRTQSKLSGNKAGNFGDIKSTRNVLQRLSDEIREVSETGVVNLIDANAVKRGAGTKGAWVFGSADPEANAIEKVYTAFYRELKKEIEKQSPAGISMINKQISDLIPIQNAVLRRIPVAERNNVIGLTDSMASFSALFDPRALALEGVNIGMRSGKVGAKLAKTGEKISNPKNDFLQRFMGKYKIDPIDEKALYDYLQKDLGIGKEQLLALPVGKTSGVVNNVAIKLPEKSQSTLEALERKILAEQKRNTGDIDVITRKMIEAFKNAKSSEYQKAVADIIAKNTQKKPLTRIEKAILEMRLGR